MIKHILITLAAILICSLTKAQSTLAEYHFEAEGITEVFVDGIFCDVSVETGNKLKFDGLITGSGKEGDYQITSIQNGSTVIFKVEKNTNISRAWEMVNKSRLDLVVPAYVNLNIENSSGDINVKGVKGEDHSIKTTSGDVFLENMEGSLSGRSTSGDIQIYHFDGDIHMSSTSGDQFYQDIDGDIETESTSGEIKIDGLKGDLIAQATSGDIQLDEFKGQFHIQTTSGGIEGRSIYMLGDSKARATSGDIELIFVNDLEDIGFDLDASSGDLEVGNFSSEDRLVIQRGEIVYQGYTTSGDQFYGN